MCARLHTTAGAATCHNPSTNPSTPAFARGESAKNGEFVRRSERRCACELHTGSAQIVVPRVNMAVVFFPAEVEFTGNGAADDAVDVDAASGNAVTAPSTGNTGPAANAVPR